MHYHDYTTTENADDFVLTSKSKKGEGGLKKRQEKVIGINAKTHFPVLASPYNTHSKCTDLAFLHLKPEL